MYHSYFIFEQHVRVSSNCNYYVAFGCRVFCGTWNVNGQEPSNDVREWLTAQDDRLPDIYAIGSVFQHLCINDCTNVFGLTLRLLVIHFSMWYGFSSGSNGA